MRSGSVRRAAERTEAKLFMVDDDTAMCHVLARLRMHLVRLTGLIAAAGALSALVLAPVASAHHRRTQHRRAQHRRAPHRRAHHRRTRTRTRTRTQPRLRGAAHSTAARRTGSPGCRYAQRAIASVSRPQLQRSAVCLINRQRRDHGLPALSINQRLNRSAQGWTNEMVGHRYFSHGADFSARISAVGFDWSHAGENIATGFRTPAAVVRGWMASTGHCQNILNPIYREVGTGVSDHLIGGFSSSAGTWTQDFGLLMGQRVASGNWVPAERCPYP